MEIKTFYDLDKTGGGGQQDFQLWGRGGPPNKVLLPHQGLPPHLNNVVSPPWKMLSHLNTDYVT